MKASRKNNDTGKYRDEKVTNPHHYNREVRPQVLSDSQADCESKVAEGISKNQLKVWEDFL